MATLTLVLTLTKTSSAFAPQSFLPHTSNSHIGTITSLSMASKKKGFGKSKSTPDPKPKSKPKTVEQSTSSSPPTMEVATSPAPGTDALSRLRRQKVEDRNEELRNMRDLRSVDQTLRDEPDAAVIPEPVAQRMGKRMLPFVGIPLFGGMGAFVAFWYLATYKNVEFQPALVAFSTIGILVVGLVGITYSVMSASWDVEEEGSWLGTEEFGKNFGSIRDGLRRTRENAILREKMGGLREEEIERAIGDLDKKEAAEKKKGMDLKEKLEKNLE